MKRWFACIAVVYAAGCGVGSDRTTTLPGVTTEFAPSETSPDGVPPSAQAPVPFSYADPAAPSSPFPAFFTGESGSVDVLGALLDALLFEMLAPSGSQFLARPEQRLIDSMTYLERLCLEGDDTDTYCRQQFSR